MSGASARQCLLTIRQLSSWKFCSTRSRRIGTLSTGRGSPSTPSGDRYKLGQTIWMTSFSWGACEVKGALTTKELSAKFRRRGATTALRAFRLRRKQSENGENDLEKDEGSVQGTNRNISQLFESQAKVRESRSMPSMREMALGVSVNADGSEDMEEDDEAWLSAMTYDPSEYDADPNENENIIDDFTTIDGSTIVEAEDSSFQSNESRSGDLNEEKENIMNSSPKMRQLKRVQSPFSGIGDKIAERRKEDRSGQRFYSVSKETKDDGDNDDKNEEVDDDLRFLREGGSASNEETYKRRQGNGVSWGQTTNVIRLSGPDSIYEEEEYEENGHGHGNFDFENNQESKIMPQPSDNPSPRRRFNTTSFGEYRRLQEEEGDDILDPFDQEEIDEFEDQQERQNFQTMNIASATLDVTGDSIREELDNNYQDFLKRSASGTGSQTQEELLEQRLMDISTTLSKEHNDGEPLNVNSPRQVAKLLFGTKAVEDAAASLSTSRDTLEAMLLGTANYEQASIARQILEWRKCRAQLKRLRHRQEAYARREVKAQEHLKMGTTPLDRDPLLLVDASAFIFRAYHAMPPLHRQSDGAPVGAVLGFCNMLTRMVMDKLLLAGDDVEQLPRLVLVFDSRDGTNFRKELYSEYKAHRPPVPEDLRPQFKMVQEAANIFGIPSLEAKGYEADDVIATVTSWATQQGMHVNLISSDKDLLQLVQDGPVPGEEPNGDSTIERQPSVCMVDPMTLKRMEEADVLEKWGVPPAQLGDVLALAGDASDNVPGVPGIGPKIASSLLQEYGSLEQVLAHAASGSVTQKKRRENLIQYADQARLSRQLVDLCRDVPPANIVNVLDEYNSLTDHDHSVNLDADDALLDKSEEVEQTMIRPETIRTTLRMKPLNQEAMLNFLHRMSLHDLGRRMASKFDRANRNGNKKSNSVIAERDISSESSSRDNQKVLEFGADRDIFFDSMDVESVLEEEIDSKAKYRPPERRPSSVPSPPKFDDIPF